MCVWGGGGGGDVTDVLGFGLFFVFLLVLGVSFLLFLRGGMSVFYFVGCCFVCLLVLFFFFFFPPLYSSLIDSVGVKTQLSKFVHGLTMLVMCCYTVLCFELFLTLGQVKYKSNIYYLLIRASSTSLYKEKKNIQKSCHKKFLSKLFLFQYCQNQNHQNHFDNCNIQ